MGRLCIIILGLAMAFSKAKADRACQFIETHCRWVKGPAAGTNIQLEPWMRDVVRKIFGTLKDDGSGLRQITKAFVLVPRKNGKSMGLGTPFGLLTLFGDDPPEYGAEIYSCAHDKEQASICFNMARSMINLDPELSRAAHIVPHKRLIEFPRFDSFWRALPRDGLAAQGYDPHCVIFDEVHTQPDDEMISAMEMGQGARTQPLMFKISTEGKDPGGVCAREIDYAEKWIEGVVENPNYHAVLYRKRPEDDWRKESTWRRCNPSSFRNFDEMRQMYELAKHDKFKELKFRLYYLNEPVDEAAAWLSMPEWDATAGILDESSLKGQQCWGALDLSSTQDMTSWVMVFPDAASGTYRVLCRNFLPREGIKKKSEEDGAMYLQWAEEGLLTLTDGNMIDLEWIYKQVCQDAEEYQIQEIAYDPFRSTELIPKLQAEGLTIFPHRQGFLSMGPSTFETERLILGRQLVHGGNKVLRWAFSNTVVEADAHENKKPSKRMSKSRIDPVVALVMAAGRASLVARAGPSIYETEGLLGPRGAVA